jgi:hypothetical protein
MTGCISPLLTTPGKSSNIIKASVEVVGRLLANNDLIGNSGNQLLKAAEV